MVRIWNAMRGIRLPPWPELLAGVREWARTEGYWYAASATVHLLAAMCLLLVPVEDSS